MPRKLTKSRYPLSGHLSQFSPSTISGGTDHSRYTPVWPARVASTGAEALRVRWATSAFTRSSTVGPGVVIVDDHRHGSVGTWMASQTPRPITEGGFRLTN